VVVSMLTASDIRAAGGLPDGVTVLPKPIPFEDLREIIAHQFHKDAGLVDSRF
jgi:hypothetical protein